MPKKTTPAQRFAQIFRIFVDNNTPEGERTAAERQLDAWLKRHGKTRADIPAILAQAVADDAAAQPPPPPSDPRDNVPHPFDNPEFTAVGLVEGIVAKYVTMKRHVLLIYSLCICFTHVYTKFAIAPRVVLTSELSESGKTTALKVAKRLVWRPNPEALGTGAAIREYLDQGPGTVTLDELDQLEPEARRLLLKIWNLGHDREDAKISLMVAGKRKVFDLYAPMIAAGLGNFLDETQMSRVFKLEMEQYNEKTRPELDYLTCENFDALNEVYSFLRHWAPTVKLNLKPPIPEKLLRRAGDNVRGLLSVADACGPEWGVRAREALTLLFDEVQAERPHIKFIEHGLVIFDALGVDQIGSVRFNQELKRLDLPDARWTRYRGRLGVELAHPIEMNEQAALAEKVGIKSERIRPPGENQCRGYTRSQFLAAKREYCPAPSDEPEPARGRLRLINPSPD